MCIRDRYLTTSLTSIVKKEPLKGECIGKYIIVYHYLSHLREVFLVFRTNSLFANSDRCTFYVDSVKSLGFIGNENGDMLTPRKSRPSKNGQHNKMEEMLGVVMV